eukprot:GCRY01001960.1.p1 GENE.GCRY01001960.1~~GCRY01001960.1.p1  ORF type:complete len:901 (-),score=288.42 GCRY01001960.1:707-3409(-)
MNHATQKRVLTFISGLIIVLSASTTLLVWTLGIWGGGGIAQLHTVWDKVFDNAEALPELILPEDFNPDSPDWPFCRHSIFCLIDGARYDQFWQTGNTPRIEEYFTRFGVIPRHGLSLVEMALSSAGFVSIFTGIDPPFHGVHGVGLTPNPNMLSVLNSARDVGQTVFLLGTGPEKEIMKDMYDCGGLPEAPEYDLMQWYKGNEVGGDNFYPPTLYQDGKSLENTGEVTLDDFNYKDIIALKSLFNYLDTVKNTTNFPNIMFFPIGDTDTPAHETNPFSEETIDAVKEVDHSLSTIVDYFHARGADNDTFFVYFGDHGQSNMGGHGGGEYFSKHPVLMMSGPGLTGTHSMPSGLKMREMTCILSFLLNIPLPRHSMCRIPWEYLNYDISPASAKYSLGYALSQVMREHYHLQILAGVDSAHATEFGESILNLKKDILSIIEDTKADSTDDNFMRNGMLYALIERVERAHERWEKHLHDYIIEERQWMLVMMILVMYLFPYLAPLVSIAFAARERQNRASVSERSRITTANSKKGPPGFHLRLPVSTQNYLTYYVAEFNDTFNPIYRATVFKFLGYYLVPYVLFFLTLYFCGHEIPQGSTILQHHMGYFFALALFMNYVGSIYVFNLSPWHHQRGGPSRQRRVWSEKKTLVVGISLFCLLAFMGSWERFQPRHGTIVRGIFGLSMLASIVFNNVVVYKLIARDPSFFLQIVRHYVGLVAIGWFSMFYWHVQWGPGPFNNTLQAMYEMAPALFLTIGFFLIYLIEALLMGLLYTLLHYDSARPYVTDFILDYYVLLRSCGKQSRHPTSILIENSNEEESEALCDIASERDRHPHHGHTASHGGSTDSSISGSPATSPQGAHNPNVFTLFSANEEPSTPTGREELIDTRSNENATQRSGLAAAE